MPEKLKDNARNRQYALHRLTNLGIILQNRIKEECTTPEVVLANSQKMKMIRTGKVKLRKDAEVGLCLEDAYDFSKYEKREVFDKKKFDKHWKPLAKEIQWAKDQSQLGNLESALKTIQELSKMV